ncbi:hypothetical protein [Basilea psittacipulmonis]|uniref:Lysozyme inhibitor LprI N-terminal domain-containing protein n=1 Tax=Basilea psittacipulmonis DSM 24701 TaxID=1072685 RepID=A0A077DI72_9BURK|nr:hypothetical protein [Basilea psittacipulmonis]AIL33207.1 hypothetical protein IX83_07780 [Basilea psittacipulmonis DSM 24701]
MKLQKLTLITLMGLLVVACGDDKAKTVEEMTFHDKAYFLANEKEADEKVLECAVDLSLMPKEKTFNFFGENDDDDQDGEDLSKLSPKEIADRAEQKIKLINAKKSECQAAKQAQRENAQKRIKEQLTKELATAEAQWVEDNLGFTTEQLIQRYERSDCARTFDMSAKCQVAYQHYQKNLSDYIDTLSKDDYTSLYALQKSWCENRLSDLDPASKCGLLRQKLDSTLNAFRTNANAEALSNFVQKNCQDLDSLQGKACSDIVPIVQENTRKLQASLKNDKQVFAQKHHACVEQLAQYAKDNQSTPDKVLNAFLNTSAECTQVGLTALEMGLSIEEATFLKDMATE